MKSTEVTLDTVTNADQAPRDTRSSPMTKASSTATYKLFTRGDSSPNGRDLAFNGAVLQRNGTLLIPSQTVYADTGVLPTTNFSIVGAAYVTTAGIILGNADASSPTKGIRITLSSSLLQVIKGPSTNAAKFAAVLNTWIVYGANYDGTTLKLVDDTGNLNSKAVGVVDINAGVSLRFGSQPGTGGFVGTVGPHALFNTALTDAEITDLMAIVRAQLTLFGLS